jgi:4-hydroxybenzoate polyprenyltransferase
MGGRVKGGVAGFYAATIALWGLAFWFLRADPLALLALLPVALHLLWQVATLNADDPTNPLDRFRSNRTAGVLMALACFTVGNA